MRCRFWIVVAAVIGFAPVSFGQMTTTTCPECSTDLGPKESPKTHSCVGCGDELDVISPTPQSCSELGGTVEGSQCKLVDGRNCALDSLASCSVALAPESEEWGE